MAGGEERDVETPHARRLAERKDVFVAFPREAGLHEAGGALGDDDLVVRRDVVAVRVRDERERFGIPGIEPDVFVRQKNAAPVVHPDHAGN